MVIVHSSRGLDARGLLFAELDTLIPGSAADDRRELVTTDAARAEMVEEMSLVHPRPIGVEHTVSRSFFAVNGAVLGSTGPPPTITTSATHRRKS